MAVIIKSYVRPKKKSDIPHVQIEFHAESDVFCKVYYSMGAAKQAAIGFLRSLKGNCRGKWYGNWEIYNVGII
jgi:hypothetical protein